MDSVQSVHGLSGLCPWTLSSLPGFPGHCPGCPWTMFRLSTESKDSVHWIDGHCPVWLVSVDFVDGLTGLCLECPWTLSRLSTKSMGNVHWVHGQCPGCSLSPWTSYRRVAMLVWGIVQLQSRKLPVFKNRIAASIFRSFCPPEQSPPLKKDHFGSFLLIVFKDKWEYMSLKYVESIQRNNVLNFWPIQIENTCHCRRYSAWKGPVHQYLDFQPWLRFQIAV